MFNKPKGTFAEAHQWGVNEHGCFNLQTGQFLLKDEYPGTMEPDIMFPGPGKDLEEGNPY